MSNGGHWTDYTPGQAINLNLTMRPEIEAPLNEEGERCPWPWEPQQLVGVPLGQYHCPYCGAMVLAGVPHIDYRYASDGPTDNPDHVPTGGHDQAEPTSGTQWLGPDWVETVDADRL